MSETVKTPRLFLRNDSITDGQLVFCGGPDLHDAIDGLRNYLSCDPNTQLISGELDLQIIAMSDEEINALPEG